MSGNLLMGLGTMVLCLMCQAVLVAITVRFYVFRRKRHSSHTFKDIMALLSAVMLLLIIGNALQITIWAYLFLMLGEFTTFSVAIYHSAVNFSTLGYGDIVMSEQHSLLGPLEALNGVLMIGMTTAVMTWVLQDMLQNAFSVQK